jgi:hypothetical protein
MNVKKPRRVEREITIERESCETDFTTLPNAIARDERLKPAAGFILYYILTKPPTWKVIPAEVAGRMKMKLPAVRKVLTELIRLGYGKRDFVRDDRKRIIGIKYFFSSRPKYLEDAPEAETGEAVMQKTESRQSYATVKSTPVLSNDSNKLPPKSPPEVAASADERVSPPPVSGQIPNSSTGNAGNPSSAPPDRTTEGQPRKVESEPLRPVTFADAKRQYEAHNSRKLAKAEEAWPELSLEQQLHALAVMPQYFAHCARLAKKPVELWRYLRLGVFRQYPPPRKPGELPPAKELPPDPESVMATELGLRAAEGRWVLELVEFIQSHRRIPEYGECDALARTGAAKHLELIDQEREAKAGTLIAPMVPVFLAKRRMLIAKALRMHGRSPPGEDAGHADPPARPAWPKENHIDDFADLHYGSR